MFVVVGATGNTGSAAIDALLQAGHPVRGIVRRAETAEALRARGAEAAVAAVDDAEALTVAFEGAEAVYLMNPPAYAEPDLFARAAQVHASLIAAAERAKVKRIVALSSVGGQHAAGTGNILTTYDLETRLASCSRPTTILRAANFMDNWGWGLKPAMEKGVLPSMFLPLDRKLPMQAARDVGAAAAALMTEGGPDRRLVELHGPEDVSPDDAAAALTAILGRPVAAVAVPEAEWASRFRAQSMPERSVAGFCEMFQGFNSGLIVFEGRHETRRGPTTPLEALKNMVLRSEAETRR